MPGFQPLLAPTMWSVAVVEVAEKMMKKQKKTRRGELGSIVTGEGRLNLVVSFVEAF